MDRDRTLGSTRIRTSLHGKPKTTRETDPNITTSSLANPTKPIRGAPSGTCMERMARWNFAR